MDYENNNTDFNNQNAQQPNENGQQNWQQNQQNWQQGQHNRVCPCQYCNYSQQNWQGQQQNWQGPQQSWQQSPQNHASSEERPSTYMVLAILSTVCCCIPFGIVSIVYANKVDTLWYQGLYEEARKSSRRARNWALASILTTVAFYFLYIFFAIIIAAMN